LRHLDRRWTRSVLIERLKHAALDVGEALVAGAGAQEQLLRFAWLVDVAAQAGLLEAHELQQARRAIQTAQALLPTRPAA
jgi:hypothetical protein